MKRHEANGKVRLLQIKELHNLYSLLSIVRIIKASALCCLKMWLIWRKREILTKFSWENLLE